MLPKEDGGVVDKNLLVYGTKNLRIVSFVYLNYGIEDSHSICPRLTPLLFHS